MEKRTLFNLVIWLLASLLIVLTIRELPLADLGSRLTNIPLASWLTLLIVNITILFLALKRWQMLAQIFEVHLSLTYLFKIRQAGGIISFVTPGPQFGGEPLQVYWLHQNHGIPLDIAIATLGIDRFLETTINLFVLLLSIIFILGTDIETDLSQAFLFTLLALAILMMLTMLFLKKLSWLVKIFNSLSARFFHKDPTLNNNRQPPTKTDFLLPKIKKNLPKFLLAITLAFVGWFCLILELHLMVEALGLSPNFYEVVFIMLGIRLALLMPIPGGIGTVETSLLWSFGVLEFALAGAGGVIAISRLRDLLLLLIGMCCLSSLTKSNSRPKSRSNQNV